MKVELPNDISKNIKIIKGTIFSILLKKFEITIPKQAKNNIDGSVISAK
tara:strand:+ start:650 stop:796 length:147 start_codon:yes stop_codon:yes gene_type:complete